MEHTNSPGPNELIDMARRGDTAALGYLLELYRNYIKLMARLQIDRRFRGKLDPSDLVQETFLESHRDFDGFRGSTEQEFLAWLRTILVRNLADRVRRHYRAEQRDIRLETSLQDELDRSSEMLGRDSFTEETLPAKKHSDESLLFCSPTPWSSCPSTIGKC